MVLGF